MKTFAVLLSLCAAWLAACSGPAATPAPPAGEPTALPATAVPTAVAPAADPEVVEDVIYATAVHPDADDQIMDVYYLPGSQAGKPVVIYAHGSGQSKSSGYVVGRKLAREGYVVLTVDWRDEFVDNRDPAYLREALENGACMLRAAAEQAALYGADPQQVIWSGFSAGAWLGSMMAFGEGDLAVLFNDYAKNEEDLQQRVACTAAAPPAAITAYVPTGGAFPGDFWLGNGVNAEWTPLLDPAREFSALGHNPGLKVRLLHGRQDFSYDTRFKDAETFAAALDEAGYDVAFLPQEGSHESFQLAIIDEVLALDGR